LLSQKLHVGKKKVDLCQALICKKFRLIWWNWPRGGKSHKTLQALRRHSKSALEQLPTLLPRFVSNSRWTDCRVQCELHAPQTISA